jgi:hypothetical protein
MEHSVPDRAPHPSSAHEDYKQSSVDLNGLLYESFLEELTGAGQVKCFLTTEPRDFPRNVINFGGKSFPVAILSVTCWRVVMPDNLVIPRMIQRIDHRPLRFCGWVLISAIAFEFHSKLAAVESRSFCWWMSLRFICLPASVETIDEEGFTLCRPLLLLTFESGSKLTRIKRSAFADASLTSVSLPAALDTIESAAFCDQPLSFMIFEPGSKLRRIEEAALYGCSSLKWICLPASVEFLGEGAFMDCSSLSSLTFESGSKLTEIHPKAFYGCSSLESLCLPAPLQVIDGSALAKTRISKVTIDEGNRHFRISGHYLLDSTGIWVIRYFGSNSTVTLSPSIQILTHHCFLDCGFLCSLKCESGSTLARIDEEALCDCSSLQTVSLPASVEFLGRRSLASCSSLRSLTFESGSKLTRIESYALPGCRALQALHLPASLEFLGTNSLAECSSLSSVTFESGSKLARIEPGTFMNCQALKQICLPASVESVGDRAFWGCSSLSSLTFEPGSKLTEIQTEVLQGCLALKSICLPASLKTIHGSALASTGISTITVDEGNTNFRVSGHFLLDSTGTSVIRYFGSDSNVTLNREIETLGRGCFYACEFLTALNFESESRLTQIEPHALFRCSSLQSICFPASVEVLTEKSVSLCRSLSSVTFESGSKLRRIENNAFYESQSLQLLWIPASIEELGEFWCTLKLVIFEFASSLRRMIERKKVYVREDFHFKFDNVDCELDFPGYSVEPWPDNVDSFRLVKIVSQE